MVETIANVLTGVATLEVKNPDTHRAEWSDEKYETGSYAVKLSKPLAGAAHYCSTHVEFVPHTAGGEAVAVDMADFVGAAGAGDWGWSHYRHGIVGSYWEQFELHFEDPLTTAWVDVTVQVDVGAVGGDAWVAEAITGGAGENVCFFGGWSETYGSFSDYVAREIDDGGGNTTDSLIEAIIAETNVADWVLTRVRLELWETSTERYVYVDDVIMEGVTYTLEPGGSVVTSALRLSSNFTEIGYTEDGVTLTYTADEADIEVEEETFPIDRVLTKETAEITCNMAESSLFNMDKAMAGSLWSGNILKLGAGTNKKMTIQLHGTNPAGYTRAIQIPSCTATGAVGMPYKKGEKTVVPVTFQALKTTGHPAVTITDNVA